MREKGLTSTVDIIFFTLIISLACLLLIGSSSMKHKFYNSHHAESTAQSSLLIFQEVPVEKFSSLSYTPKLPLRTISSRNLKQKTISQLITEDVLLNPRWKIDNTIQSSAVNREFSEKLDTLLKKSLDKLVGKRYDYKLTVQLNPMQISEKKSIQYQKTIENFTGNSEKICSESITLDFTLPSTWQEKPTNTFHPSKTHLKESPVYSNPLFYDKTGKNTSDNSSPRVDKVSSIILVLELWSK